MVELAELSADKNPVQCPILSPFCLGLLKPTIGHCYVHVTCIYSHQNPYPKKHGGGKKKHRIIWDYKLTREIFTLLYNIGVKEVQKKNKKIAGKSELIIYISTV